MNLMRISRHSVWRYSSMDFMQPIPPRAGQYYMQYYMRCILLILLSLSLTAKPAFSWPTVHPTGTTLYNPDAANDGYTLFAPVGKKAGGASTVFLINMRGEPVHRWDVPLFALHGRLLPNGNLLFLGQNE